jgi:L-aspartate oxidase
MDNLMKRYLKSFDTESVKTVPYDVLIIGSGIAGVYTALEIPEEYSVGIITKEEVNISNSILAQGGIAVSLDKEDSPELHFKDTINAGAGLCNEESVWVLVNEAEENIKTLIKYQVEFDRDLKKVLKLTREAAHSKKRIIHSRDTTGKEVCEKLTAEAYKRKNIDIIEKVFAIDFITDNDSVCGVMAYNENEKDYLIYKSGFVVCSTGGFGRVYSNTTNPEVATGDGMAMAYRAGLSLMDMEFIQFHPTVLYHPKDKTFLISEAVRGEGGILRNINNKKFMYRYHKKAELAPRDIVSRSIFKEMLKTNSKNVFLDITHLGKEFIIDRFPNIYQTCLNLGIDITLDYIPVAPAEHYCMGGVKTDIHGKTDINGLYFCGEVACTGIHGANRLASNSLLEGLVFGNKISKEVESFFKDRKETEIKKSDIIQTIKSRDLDIEGYILELQKIMNSFAGIVRDGERLSKARQRIVEIIETVSAKSIEEVRYFELVNMLTVSKLVLDSAIERTESRGGHFRSDYPKRDDEKWRKNIIIKP